MSLKDQLRVILKDVLPGTPEEAVFGTELIETVTPRLARTYAPTSILQTFSALAADSTSPIARIEQGFGYYRRPEAQVQKAEPATSVEAPSAETLRTSLPSRPRDIQLEEKFRAFFMRQSRYQSRFPVHIEHTSANQQPSGVNKWKFPDVVELDWEDVGEIGDDGFVLDKALLEVKKSLGEQPFRLSSIELKVELTLGSFREHFFQCVSNSMWSHSARLVVACSISDALLAGELRRLGTSFGVQIQSFEMSIDKLDAMPAASDILGSSNAEFRKATRCGAAKHCLFRQATGRS